MAQTTINVRMDEGLKKQVESIFADMGLNMSTAVNIFARAVVQRREIPFKISASDHFYSEENMKYLEKEAKKFDAGEGIITKTFAELEAMEHYLNKC
jgi:DNA-damage-inducible protein J